MAAASTGGSPPALSVMVVEDEPRFRDLLTDIDLGGGMSGVELGIQMRRRSAARGVVLLSNLSKPSLLGTIPPDVQGGWSYLLQKNVPDPATGNCGCSRSWPP